MFSVAIDQCAESMLTIAALTAPAPALPHSLPGYDAEEYVDATSCDVRARA